MAEQGSATARPGRVVTEGILVAAIAGVRPVPAPVIEVVAEPDGGIRKPHIVEDDVQEITPPSISGHVEVVQHLREVEAELESDLPLPIVSARIALRAVRDRQEQVLDG